MTDAATIDGTGTPAVPPRDVVVITGIGGMGMACARRLGQGRRIAIAEISPARLDAALGALRAEGHDADGTVLDVADRDAVRAFVRATAASGRIAAAVHTAGISPTMGTPAEIYRADLIGTAIVIDELHAVATPGMCLVCIASMGALRAGLSRAHERVLATTPTDELDAVVPTLPDDCRTAYAVSKRANQLRVEQEAHRWGLRGARIVTISPGIISTPMVARELAGDHGPDMRANIAASAGARLGTPDDIAAAAAFLTGPDASFVTGSDLLVDGGEGVLLKALLHADPE